MCYSLLVEGLFRYNTHFIITLFSLGSHNEHYDEVAVYFNERVVITTILITMKVVNYSTATSLSTVIFSFPNKTIKFAVVQLFYSYFTVNSDFQFSK